MKKLLAFAMVVLAFYGCENKEIKVVKVIDGSYMNRSQVDKPPVIEKTSLDTNWVKNYGEILTDLSNTKNASKEFDARLLIDEKWTNKSNLNYDSNY